MSIILQTLTIFAFSYVGTLISTTFKLPIPGSIIGIVLLFSALYFKIIKVKQVEPVGNWLKDHMALLFIPITVGLMEEFDIISPHLFKLTLIIMISTALTYILVAWVVERINHDI